MPGRFTDDQPAKTTLDDAFQPRRAGLISFFPHLGCAYKSIAHRLSPGPMQFSRKDSKNCLKNSILFVARAG